METPRPRRRIERGGEKGVQTSPAATRTGQSLHTKELKIMRSAEKKELLGEAVVCRSRMEKGTPQTLVALSGKKARRGTSPRGLLAEEEQLSIKKFRTARS